MLISISQNFIEKGNIIIPVLETDNDYIEIEKLSISLSKNTFSGKKDSYYCLEKDNITFILVGLGKAYSHNIIKESFRRIAYKNKAIFKNDTQVLIPDFFDKSTISSFLNGLYLGTYELNHLKTEDKAKHSFLNNNYKLNLYTTYKDAKEFALKGIKIAQAQILAMTLVDLPSNIITPTHIAEKALELEKEFTTVKTTIFNREKCKKLGLEAFISVGKGSTEEPKFITIEYNPKEAKSAQHIGLVGKGITFDTGGLNIKVKGMYFMKCDMGGGAAVLGAMKLIASLRIPTKVTAIIPCSENSVDGNSYKPSDVIYSYSKKTIEITDTDAEGRLALADGIAYMIKNYKPDVLLDIATLTGSCVNTFGSECGALFTNNDTLKKNLEKIGLDIGEKIWSLPLWESYESDNNSDIADIKNYSQKPVAGAISAAKFIEFFTEKHQAWVHLDIAGVAFGDDEYGKNKHATGFGVHLITNFVESF